MITEEFKCYLQGTYRDDIFHYKLGTLEKVCKWGDKWQPDSIKLFKTIITRIKAGKGDPDKNPLKKNGKYISLRMADRNYMTVFFEPLQLPDKNKFYIYDFEVNHYGIDEFA